MSTNDLNRINKRILDIHSGLSKMYCSLALFLEDPKQEILDEIFDSLVTLDTENISLKNSIKTFIQETVGIEQEEVDIIPADNGYKL